MRKSAAACENFRRAARKSNASARRQLYRAALSPRIFCGRSCRALLFKSVALLLFIQKIYARHARGIQKQNRRAARRAGSFVFETDKHHRNRRKARLFKRDLLRAAV